MFSKRSWVLYKLSSQYTYRDEVQLCITHDPQEMWRCCKRKVLGCLIHRKQKKKHDQHAAVSAQCGENIVMEFVIHFHFNFEWDQEMWRKNFDTSNVGI